MRRLLTTFLFFISVLLINAQPQPVCIVTANNISPTSNIMVNWLDYNKDCKYSITPVLIFNNTPFVLDALSLETSDLQFIYPYDTLHYANLYLRIDGMAKYQFEVRAIKDNIQSPAVRSCTPPLNVN